MNEENYEKLVSSIEEKEKKSSRINVIVISVIIILIAIIISISKMKVGEQLVKKDKLISEKDRQLVFKDSSIVQIKEQTAKTLDVVISDSSISDSLRNAIDYTKKKLNIIDESNKAVLPLDTVIVRYYKRKEDDDKIMNILVKNGFKVNIRESKLPHNEPINTVWYGDQVNDARVKLLALELIESGIEIKGIRPFKKGRGYEWKSKSIEIGFSTLSEKYKPILKEELIDTVLKKSDTRMVKKIGDVKSN